MFNSVAAYAQYLEFRAFFLGGSPPLIFQILIINTIFLIYVIVRRINKKPTRNSHMVNAIQICLVAANFVIVFERDLFSMTLEKAVRSIFG